MRDFDSGGGVQLNYIHLVQLLLHEESAQGCSTSQDDTTTTQIEYHCIYGISRK